MKKLRVLNLEREYHEKPLIRIFTNQDEEEKQSNHSKQSTMINLKTQIHIVMKKQQAYYS